MNGLDGLVSKTKRPCGKHRVSLTRERGLTGIVPGSGSVIETVDEILWQSRLAHLRLGGRDIVFDTVVLNSRSVAIKNCVAGPNIPITGLSDAARVYYAAALIQQCWPIQAQWQKYRHRARFVANERLVGMAHKTVGGFQQIEGRLSLGRMEEIFDYWSPQAAVDEGEGRLPGDSGKAGKKVLLFGIELTGRPANRG